MTLVVDPNRLSEEVLRELLTTLRADLEETEELVRLPSERVRDPASLEVAADLLRSARTILDAPGAGGRTELAARANLAYAALLGVIDLVKSHTDLPRVPRPRGRPAPKG